MQVNPEEISRILKEEIKAYSNQMEFTEAGSVIQVGDGIAQVHGGAGRVAVRVQNLQTVQPEWH